jgi:hypothetical protein
MKESKNGFFKLNAVHAISVIIFFAVSILAFMPFVYSKMWNGLNLCSWTLCLIALAIPIYNIIIAAISNKNQKD